MVEEVFKLAISIENPFDYNLLVILCKKQFLEPPVLMHYYQKIGLLMAAKFEYPQLPIEEAYSKLLERINTEIPRDNTIPKTGCSGCGGGKTL